jgi:hypothetical protein
VATGTRRRPRSAALPAAAAPATARSEEHRAQSARENPKSYETLVGHA